MSLYVTPYELRVYKGLSVENPTDDARVWRAALNATKAWERWTFRRFEPYRATYYFDHVDGMELRFKRDLLEVLELKTQNGAVTIADTDYLLQCGRRYDLQPYDRIVLRTDKGVLFSFAGTEQQANQVTGIWGYHNDYSAGWEDTGDTVQNAAGLDTTGGTLLVADADAPDWYGFLPRFQVGQLLKIEDEFLYLWSTAGQGTNTLGVRRAANGTTAATHAKDTPIYRWRVLDDVYEHVQELAAYLFDLKDSQVYDVTATPETGMMTIPKGVPVQVRLAIKAYRRY